jgi:hypothetical protein
MGFQPTVPSHAIVKVLDKETDVAHQGDVDRDRAALDATELREFERTEYYDAAPTVTDAAPVDNEVTRLRRLIDRLFRR